MKRSDKLVTREGNRFIVRSGALSLDRHWAFLSLIPLGFGAWAPVYAGIKARRWLWILLGALWTAIIIAAFAVNATTASGQHGHNDSAGGLFILGWVGAIATSFMIRPAYERQMGSKLQRAIEAGEQRLADHQRALRLAEHNPRLAKEIGVGRPDRHGAADGGLVDVNNASVTALLELPGIDGDLATEICECREKLGGFSSLEDLGETLDLGGDVVEGLRDRVVFLPRGS
ncbi:MAG: ComEA family DNA-binding protein [Solirubrobacteraceae bacterium]